MAKIVRTNAQGQPEVVFNEVIVDSALSKTSENAIQNKAVGVAVGEINDSLSDLDTSLDQNSYGENAGGVNLLNVDIPTQTVNGITLTNNGDGTYTLNGTATAQTVLGNTGRIDNVYKGKKLLGINQGSSSTYSFLVSYYAGGSWKSEEYQTTRDGLIVSSDYDTITLGVIVRNGITLNNVIFKPMITDNLSATYDDFRPYIKSNKMLTEEMGAINTNNAPAHNAIFRGKDLTNVYTIDQICQRISAGTFEDLYIGDYFDVTINGEGSEVVRCILAGFDTYLHNGDTDFSRHHAVIVTKNCLNTLHQMNPTNTTEGGFVGSDMWKTVLPKYNTAFGNVFGSHLLSHRTILSNAMTSTLASNAGAGYTGATSGWAWTDTKLSLLSEIQVYGANVFSSSFYDTGCDNLQLPLFALDPTAKVCGKGGTGGGGQWYWLRNVASATHFARVNDSGDSNGRIASVSGGVRPLFCIG